MVTRRGSRNTQLNLLLIAFFTGAPKAREAFAREATPYIRKVARHLAPDLPEDLQVEVVGQVFVNLLLQGAGSFSSQRGSAASYLRLHIRNAVRQVRAAYAMPGHVTRARKVRGTKKLASRVGPSLVSLNELLAEDQEPANTASVAAIEAGLDAVTLLKSAPERVAWCLVRLHAWGDTLNEVAAELRVSRFVLGREVAAFEESVRQSA
jgi:hypothetical protein